MRDLDGCAADKFVDNGVAGDEVGQPKLAVVRGMSYGGDVTTTRIIEEIKHLSPAEQAEVIQFAFTLAKTRPLAATELNALARRLVESDDPAEVERLKSAIARGFYGEEQPA